MERERPQSWTKPSPPVTIPGEYRKVVPALEASLIWLSCFITLLGGGSVLSEPALKALRTILWHEVTATLALHTGFVDLNGAAVGDLFEQPQ